MVTLRDVASHAGVSVSVVSRVLNSDPTIRIRPETRERVVESARLLRYAPNSAGRSLRRARTHLLALVVPDVTNATFTDLVNGVEARALDHSYSVLLASSPRMQPGSEGFNRLLNERLVDGVLLQKDDSAPTDLVARALTHPEHTVMINSGPVDGVRTIGLDDVAAGALATRHLLELGHRSIGYVGGVPASDTSSRRQQGVERELGEAGLTLPREHVTTLGYTYRSARDAVRLLLGREPRPTALVVGNVNAGIGALTEAAQMGISVPEELSVVAIHDIWPAITCAPALTTIRLPMGALGSTAVDMLLDGAGADRVDPISRVVEDPAPELVLRASTAAVGT
ncbi:LacI family DNA-binding transcriptional regulator [Ruania alkalisoli]|uniref:LacI family DNA-binding transcriptional regulator n=1 Tax=Ruania alkalisoli TaxID=2779775 RepID=A0A7M1SSU2_9MICO|nr:LacI family DNA-binding transcriptional regulator [Ruania alkalisoli]QOR70555.1 LacI family DNA-binding transcriptional regulator [Ruania alkalisoli]